MIKRRVRHSLAHQRELHMPGLGTLEKLDQTFADVDELRIAEEPFLCRGCGLLQ
jgi:hypothetical protein